MSDQQHYCPFCQSGDLHADRHPASGRWAVQCRGCGASGPEGVDAEQAFAHWARARQSENLLRTVIDESPDIILLKDWDGKFLLGNAALARLYGTTPEHLVGKDDGAFNPNREQVDFYLKNVQAVMRLGETQLVEEHSTDVETGETHYFHSIKKPLTGPDGEPRILVIAHDITELRRAHQAIEERERSYAYAMAAAGEGIWDWDMRRNRVTHNTKWCEMLGVPTTQLQHPIDAFSDRLHEDDREEVLVNLTNALNGSGTYQHEHRMRRADGTVIWVLDRGEVVERDEQGQALRMAGSITDISARKHDEQAMLETKRALADMNAVLERRVAERTAELICANEELRRLATHDALTGLPNRLAANQRLQAEFKRMKRSGRPHALMIIDVDHFKQINDTHGHLGGDEVLQHLAGLFGRNIRSTDFIARFGGEEFIAILPDADLDGALTLAEKIRAEVATTPAPIPDPITVSIGVALASHDDDNAEVALRYADVCLYEAKRAGRNRVVCRPPTRAT